MVTKIQLLFVVALMPLSAFSQLLEFRDIERLPALLNTAGEESLPILSPNGKELFFVRAMYAGNSGGKYSGSDAWYTEWAATSWKRPSNTFTAKINNHGHNAIVGLSSDGKKRYFVSAGHNEKVQGIYVTSRLNNYWTRPELIAIPGIENQRFLGVYVSPDFDVILLSMKAPDSRGEEDLYFTTRNSLGQWSRPRNLGPTINTRGFEISPFLSADKKRLYFASNGHGGEGDADIFFSERLYNSWETWSVPVNLGKQINSKKFDAYFSIYGDSIAYFSSNREGRYADLYQARVTQGRTVLQRGQRYLSNNEWNRQMGGAVASELIFTASKTSLSASQKELLFFIANRLQLQKDIHFHLIVVEEENPSVSEARLKAVVDYLTQSGIAEARIITDQVEPPTKESQGKIRIRLIE